MGKSGSKNDGQTVHGQKWVKYAIFLHFLLANMLVENMPKSDLGLYTSIQKCLKTAFFTSCYVGRNLGENGSKSDRGVHI